MLRLENKKKNLFSWNDSHFHYEECHQWKSSYVALTKRFEWCECLKARPLDANPSEFERLEHVYYISTLCLRKQTPALHPFKTKSILRSGRFPRIAHYVRELIFSDLFPPDGLENLILFSSPPPPCPSTRIFETLHRGLRL